MTQPGDIAVNSSAIVSDNAPALNDRLARIIENSLNEILIYDATTLKFILANGQARDNLGLSGLELNSATLADIMPGYSPAELREIVAWLRNDRSRRREFETRLERKDGGRYDARIILHAMDGETPPIVVAFSEDITEKKKRDIEFRQSRKMRAIGLLTSGISHDFNNLLTVILSNIEMAEPLVGEEAASYYLKQAKNAVINGSQLVKNLLTYGQRQELAPVDIHINAVVANVAAMIRPSLGAAIDLKTALQHDLWLAHADPSQLENAIINLAINARDAMPNGGLLHIETMNTVINQEDTSEELEFAPGPYVCLSVTDSGCGMPDDVVAKAFAPFFTTKSAGRGAGLGLSMVYGFAKQSGGHVRIHSDIGIGTTVSIFLPVSAAKSECALPHRIP